MGTIVKGCEWSLSVWNCYNGRTHNRSVLGSSPSGSTIYMNGLRKQFRNPFFLVRRSVPALSQFFSVWEVKGGEGFPHVAAPHSPTPAGRDATVSTSPRQRYEQYSHPIGRTAAPITAPLYTVQSPHGHPERCFALYIGGEVVFPQKWASD